MKKELAIILEKLDVFRNPKIQLEQYPTPSGLAAELAVTANLLDSHVSRFVDLGCGTGILSIAFSLVGFEVLGVDKDREALLLARSNSEKAGVFVDFVHQDVRFLEIKERTGVVMNPPFGIQRRNADRIFLEKAFEIGEVVYSVHSAGSEKFVEKNAGDNGFGITHCWKYSIPLKRLYWFHEKPYKLINVEVFRMERI
ncbi:METTL5 family protein [Geoglobus acetivorans]|uniref:Putative RNA methylase n=1 Tax=Geoglobus acetivorans TaxID=565033 RepID=A0A0A7GEG3_GEOAI|nr:putative RNA methylase [Geoglobus acetivorans]